MGSERLPGKVIKEICGKPMLALQIERIKQSGLIDEVVISTTDSTADDVIESLAGDINVECFRGSENDVLGRVTETLKAFSVELHVEFMGDNPIPDPLVVDSVIGYYLKNADRYDFVSNALKSTYPSGFEVHVYPADVLIDAERQISRESALREHVSMHIHEHRNRYRICNLEAPPWHRRPDIYLEVDEPADLEVIRAICKHFYFKNPGFGLSQIIEFLDNNPDLILKNQGIERRWKRFRK